MTTKGISVSQSSLSPLEGLVMQKEGDQPIFAVRKLGVSAIANDATLTMYVYRGSTDVSATRLTGNMSASGNVAITKTFQNLTFGDYHVTLYGTCDGIYQCFAEFDMNVGKRSGK